MSRRSWNEARTAGERASFEFYKRELSVKCGQFSAVLFGVLDTSQDQTQRAKSPDGTYPIFATLSCWRADLGFLPTVREQMRIVKTERPEEEQAYLVVSVDSTSDLLLIELEAHTSDASPFFR